MFSAAHSHCHAAPPRHDRFGDKVSIVSYTDVVHCHFSTLNGEERDAFLFPYGSVVLWGFSEEFEMLTMEAVCVLAHSEPLARLLL